MLPPAGCDVAISSYRDFQRLTTLMSLGEIAVEASEDIRSTGPSCLLRDGLRLSWGNGFGSSRASTGRSES